MEIKDDTDLEAGDFDVNTIWVEGEDAEEFGLDVSHLDLSEDSMVKVVGSKTGFRLDVLQDLNHFWVGCTVTFHNARQFDGFARVTADDFRPVVVTLFFQGSQLDFPLSKSDVGFEEDIREIEVGSGLDRGDIYPADVAFHLEPLVLSEKIKYRL